MADTKHCVTHTSSHTQKYPKLWTPQSYLTTIVATCFNRSNPSSVRPDRRLSQEYLQSQEYHLHGCGGIHIRIGEMMSSPP
jgi:hypothetical protein